MKFKITLLLMAGIALASFSSCEIFVRGEGHGHRHHEHHEHSNRDNIQPVNNGLQNSFASPSLFQPTAQLAIKGACVLNLD